MIKGKKIPHYTPLPVWYDFINDYQKLFLVQIKYHEREI